MRKRLISKLQTWSVGTTMQRLIASAFLIITLATVWGIAYGQTRTERAGSGQETLIRNATILTVSHGTLLNSDILLRSGKIVAVGPNLKARSDARVIDATGKFVMPGIIDCHSHAMLDAINELTLSVTSMVRVSDALNPTDADLYPQLAGGTTTLNLLHGSGNAIGGQNTVVKIKYGRPVEEFIFPGAPAGIKFALGENPKRSNLQIPS